MSRVIAISGPTAVGKTTLCSKLLELMKNVTYISFDYYRRRECFPSNIKKWIEDGVDLNQIRSPDYAKALMSLRKGKSVVHPKDKNITIKSATIILTDEPFGRERKQIAKYLDFVIFIDLPLDIALARAVQRKVHFYRDSQMELFKTNPSEYIARLYSTIDEMFTLYFGMARPMYLKINETVRKNCDLIIDGLRPLDELSQELAIIINNKFGQLA